MKYRLILLFLIPFFATNAQNLWSKWEVVKESSNAIYNQVGMYSHLEAMVVGNGGVILTTDDGGNTWKDVSDPSLGDLRFIEVLTDTMVFVASHDAVFRTEDFGGTWNKVYENENGDILGISSMLDEFGDVRTHVYGRNGLLIASLSYGDSWYVQKTDLFDADNDDIVLYTSFFAGGDTLQVFMNRLGQFRTFTRREKFRTQDFLPEGDTLVAAQFVNHRRIQSTIGQYCLTSKQGKFYMARTDLNDDEFTEVDITCGAHVLFTGVNGEDSFLSVVVGQQGKILGRHDDRWSTIEYSTRKFEKVTDQDLNWVDVSVLKEGYNYQDKSIVTFLAVGDGVILRLRHNWNPESIGIQEIPKGMVDLSVHPNPTRGESILAFTLLNDASTNVSIYNSVGHLVASVFQGNLHDGVYQYRLPSLMKPGVYVVRVEAGSAVMNTRLVKE